MDVELEKVELNAGFLKIVFGLKKEKDNNKDPLSLAYHQYRDKRLIYNSLAAELYRRSGYKILDDVSLLIDDGYIKDNLIKVDEVKLAWEQSPEMTCEGLWFWGIENDGFRERVSKDIPQDKLRNDYCYRLISKDLTFCSCQYFEYMDSCENIGLKTVDALLEHVNSEANIDNIFPNGRLEPFDLTNRYCAVGVNTLFILTDKEKPIMYFHNREKNVEAEHTHHVVPAGTFQPLHTQNGYHKRDFSLSANIMREFGEEFLGHQDLMTPKPTEEILDDRPGLRALIRMYKKGMFQIYYGGFGLDSLTLKPEILTIAACNKQDWGSFIEGWEKIENNNNEDKDKIFKFVKRRKEIENSEGKVHEVEFSLDSIDRKLQSQNLLPAARGCLILAKRHFKQLEKIGID